MKKIMPRLMAFRAQQCGVSAVEFALIAPVFIVLLMGIVGYGAYFAMIHSVQQLSAEAARASVAGLSDVERATLARAYISASTNSYPFLAPSRLKVDAAPASDAPDVFVVNVSYDASNSFIFALPSFIPFPSSQIVRSAAIQRGGY
jgi:Flp pilus assembly protein TadG